MSSYYFVSTYHWIQTIHKLGALYIMSTTCHAGFFFIHLFNTFQILKIAVLSPLSTWRNVEKPPALQWQLLGAPGMLSGRWGSLPSGSPRLSDGAGGSLRTDNLAHLAWNKSDWNLGKALASELCVNLQWTPQGADLLLLLPYVRCRSPERALPLQQSLAPFDHFCSPRELLTFPSFRNYSIALICQWHSTYFLDFMDFLFKSLFFCCMACQILGLPPGIEPRPPQ